MYYEFVFLMVASYLGTHPSSPSLIHGKDQIIKFGSEDKLTSFFRLFIDISCFALCIAIVPEQPAEMASICQRHHSVEACEIF